MKSIISFGVGLIVGALVVFVPTHFSEGWQKLTQSQASKPADQLVGTWNGNAEIGGRAIDFSLAVKKEGADFSGLLSTPQGKIPTEKLAIDPVGNISFSVSVPEGSAKFTGKLEAATHLMAGNLTSSFGSGAWTLARQ